MRERTVACEVEWTIGEDDFDLTVEFMANFWTDLHAYGSTYAAKDEVEVDDVTYTFEGEIASYEELVEAFGENVVTDAINKAIERGLENAQ